jgi:nitroreductase
VTSANSRTADHPIDPIFLERWSPRSFTGEPIAEADLLTMLEAARWAASSYNAQPWRFLYARRDTEHWQRFLDILIPFNQGWAKDASALVYLVSNSLMRSPGSDKDVPSRTHSLDAGTASGYFMLQAQMMGWHVHGMVGLDAERAFKDLNVPVGHRVEAAYAVGRKADPSRLPEGLREREVPSQRRPLAELAFEGGFPPGAAGEGAG